MSKLSNIKLLPEKVPSNTFTKSDVTAGSVKNSKALPLELTRNFCEAEPKDKPAFHIPPEPCAN